MVKIVRVNNESNHQIDETKSEMIGFPLDYSLKSMAEEFESDIPESEEDDEKECEAKKGNHKNQINLHYISNEKLYGNSNK